MAWIHPVTSGDYRIMGVTVDTFQAVSSSIAVYNTNVNTDITNNAPDLNALGHTWKAYASTSTTAASDNLDNWNGAYYRTDGSIIGDGQVLTNAPTFTNAITYHTDGTSTGSISPWTGSFSGGRIHPTNPLGTSSSHAGRTDQTSYLWSAWTNITNTNYVPLFASSETISTIGGSISGTLSRESANIWAVGAITLTADVDFGGTVDIVEALDAGQTPTIDFAGFTLSVGSEGTAPAGWKIAPTSFKVRDTGTGNVILNATNEAAGGILYT